METTLLVPMDMIGIKPGWTVGVWAALLAVSGPPRDKSVHRLVVHTKAPSVPVGWS